MHEIPSENAEPAPHLEEILKKLDEHAYRWIGKDPWNLARFVMVVTENPGKASATSVWENLVVLLDELNTRLNQGKDADKGWHQRSYPAQLVYAMNSMIAQLLTCVVEHQLTREDSKRLIHLAWRISIAWSAILDTDCPSVKNDIERSELTREIQPLEEYESL